MAVARAPGRVNLIGEHTDYNAGFVLPFAIEQGCRAEVEFPANGLVRISSAQRKDAVAFPMSQLHPDAEWMSGSSVWAGYAAGVLWAMELDMGCAVHLDSDIPPGAGLSSSAALSCAVAVAVDKGLGLHLTKDALVRVAIRAETEFVRAPTGGMDQLASICATEGNALFCDMRSVHAEPVPLPLAAHHLEILVVDSRAPRALVDTEYRERRESCHLAAALLDVPALRDVTDLDDLDALPDDVLRRRARHVVTENQRVQRVAELLRAHRLTEIGPLLDESHASMRDDYEITVPEVDLAVDTLQANGALGARMTGGGFGGCVIALINEGEAERLTSALTDEFTRRGYAEPRWFSTAPAAGAA